MAVTIRDAMTDRQLFGDTFGGDSFAAWRALLGGFYGLPLDSAEADTFKELTGRAETPQDAGEELWLVVGRRGGKSHAAALCAAYEAAFKDHRDKLAPGEMATVMLIAGDRPQARTLLRYVRGLVEGNPMLRAMVVRQTETGIEFDNRACIEVHTASHRSVRGYTCSAVICDEIAFWMSDGARPDAEVIAALRPALATLGGKLVALSSPYARRGMLWDTYKRYHGQPGRVLVAQAPSRTMNPTLPLRVVDDAMKDDAARASAEYLAQFRSDIEAFLSLDQVEAVQRSKPLELPRQSGVRYVAFADPTGGGKDEFTLAIAHREGERLVVDLVRGRRGNPAAITADYAETLKAYGISRVSGDRYAGQWVPTEFDRHGITYEPAPGTRSELYATFAPALNSGAVELPPCATLSKQLTSLERRTTRGGRDMIDHAPGAHDDRANAVAGVVAQMAKKQARPQIRSLGDGLPNGTFGRGDEAVNGTFGPLIGNFR
ncbi:hypothetical protein [uncultured Roseovarius sp.]|uniref:hypothetical protein n=1 Tax=uncultured Roseovarius sp. TaxID=293344 RepID=UPI00262DF35A|nr:hypothetical protein [uncultured Roseovarius sp.]